MLTTSRGTWGGTGNTFSYQWQRSADGTTFTNIAGATLATYTLAVADEGDWVRALVTATNSDGAVTKATDATTDFIAPFPPANTTAADGHRHAAAHRGPDRQPRHLDRPGQQLQLPVAARRGRGLRGHRGRARLDLHADRWPTSSPTCAWS